MKREHIEKGDAEKKALKVLNVEIKKLEADNF